MFSGVVHIVIEGNQPPYTFPPPDDLDFAP